VVILIDSCSSHSFLNVKLASVLVGVSAVVSPIKVQAANGHVIHCVSELKQAQWSIQDTEFTADLKMLALPYYDMILGIDWLGCHSPLKVD
jgi:hypothetical protein